MTTPSLYTITLDTGHFTTDGTTTLLDAALTQGVPVPFSCQRGECGSCRATVVDGCHERLAPPTERTYVTADDELLMCQCRAAGDLALRFPHSVSYTHLRAHETPEHLVCRLLLEKKKRAHR